MNSNFNEQLAKYLTETWSYFKNVKFFGNSIQNGVPSPIAPVPIQVVPSSFNITTSGENLFNVLSPYQWEQPATGVTVIEGNRITLTGRWYCQWLFRCPKNTVCKLDYTSISGSKSMAIYTGKTLGTIGSIVSSPGRVFNTGDNSVLSVLIYSSSSSAIQTSVFEDIRITIGATSSPYTEYIGGTSLIQLKDINENPLELYGFKISTTDIEDEVDLDSGVLIRRVWKLNLKNVIFTEATTEGSFWARPNSFSCLAYNVLPAYRACAGVIGLVCPVISTHLKTGSYNWSGGVAPFNYIYINDRHLRVILSNDITGINEADTDAVKLSKVNAVFAANDIYIYSELETPYEIPLSTDTIAQLKNVFVRRPDDDDEYYLWVENTPEPEITYDTFKWQEPVYDRTLQNAKNARMGIQADFAKGIFSDIVWNRIKGNQIVIKYLISWFYEYMPVELLDLAVKKQDLVGFASWADIESWITDLDLNEMATNDRTLMSQIPTAHANYVPPKNDYVGGLGNDSTSPDWNDLNLLERTLQLIKETILSTIANYRICGEPIAAEFNEQQIDII